MARIPYMIHKSYVLEYVFQKLSYSYSGKPLGFGSVFTAFGVLFFGIGIALILFGIEELSKILGFECFIFDSYGVAEESSEYFENDWSKLLLTKDEEISYLKNQVSVLKNRLSSLKEY